MIEASKQTRFHLVSAIGLMAVALILFIQPTSTLLLRLSPDGQLNQDTAQFLDSAWIVLLALGVLFLLVALSATVRQSVGSALGLSGSELPSNEVPFLQMKVLVGIAVAAFITRCTVGYLGDPSIGDDGARNFWLRQWLEDPYFIRSGLWAPGHLYVQGVLSLVFKKVEIAGMVLAAGSYAGCILLLGVSAWRTGGRLAAISTALLAALLPVSVAYGSVSDVNTFFAFLLLAAVAAVQRAAHTGKWRWLLIAWSCIALSAWTRFEAFFLVPAIALLLWRHRGVMILFAVLSLVPTLSWNYLNYLSSGDPNMIYNAVRSDTGLAVSRLSAVFGLLTAGWQALTLPLLVLGGMGVFRALRTRRGREWTGLLLLHLTALTAATVLSATGNQPRYLILAAAILAYYAGVAIAGMALSSRRIACIVLVLASLAVVFLPSVYADHSSLWMRRDPALRSVMDCVTGKVLEGNLVWISNEASFMFPSRTDWPIERYFHASRTDSDIETLARSAGDTDLVWLCHNRSGIALKQSSELLRLWGGRFRTADRFTCNDYVVLRLERNQE